MSLQHTLTSTIRIPGLPNLPAEPPLVLNGDYGIDIEFDVLAGAVGHVTVGSIDKTKIVDVVINSTLAGTLSTNAANASGGQAIVLAAKKSFYWNNTMDSTSFPNPVSANVTALYFDNTSGGDTATVRAGFLLNV